MFITIVPWSVFKLVIIKFINFLNIAIILYENRFAGSSTTSYAPSEFWPDSCYIGNSWNTACSTDLRSYSGWTSTDGTLVFDDSLITTCGSNKYFGGFGKFGGINTVKRTYTALPDHSK